MNVDQELYAEINGERVRVVRAGANVALVDIKDNELLNTRDYNLAIAEGLITGTRSIYILGFDGDVDDIREDVWPVGGVYTFPQVPQRMIIYSSSANDMVSGTGARTVEIDYLDSNYDSHSELIYLSGTAQVATQATDILRVNDFHVMSAGSNSAPVGNISLTSISTTGTYGYLEAGYNASRVAVYTVPRNMYFYIEEWAIGVGGGVSSKYAEFSLRTTTTHEGERTTDVFHSKSSIVVQGASLLMPFIVPIKCLPRTDIKVSAISESNSNAKCSVEIRGILKANGNQ